LRLAVCESAIEALSLASVEELRPDTLYTGTAGGIGPGTVAALQQELATLSGNPGAKLIAATNAMGFLLWLRDGRLHQLEGFFFGEDTSGIDFTSPIFTLREPTEAT
jgi:hypothetical protein